MLKLTFGTGYIIKEEMALKKNNLVDVMPYMGREYEVSLDFYISKFGTAADFYQSVIHFTTSNNADMYGARCPAVWVGPQKNKKLHVASALNGNANLYYDLDYPLKIGKWINLEISQKLVMDKVSKSNFNNTNFIKFTPWTVDVWNQDQWGKRVQAWK